MTEAEELQLLRNEIAAYQQRELDDLRRRAVDAETKAEHYRREAERNADVGRQIYAQSQEQIARLQAKLESATKLENGRPDLNIRRSG